MIPLCVNTFQPTHSFQKIIHSQNHIIFREPILPHMILRNLLFPRFHYLLCLRQKTIYLIHKQRISRVIILHERCHPLIICLMPDLHTFYNNRLSATSQPVLHVITMYKEWEHIIVQYKFYRKTAEPPAAVICIRVIYNFPRCINAFAHITQNSTCEIFPPFHFSAAVY